MRSLQFLVLILFMASCGDNDIIIEVPCLSIPPEIDNDLNCEDVENTNEPICALEKLPPHQLTKDSKSFLSKYCDDIGSIIEYESCDGCIITLELIDKHYRTSPSRRTVTDGCDAQDGDKIYCVDNETVLMRYKLGNEFIEIHVFGFIDIDDQGHPALGEEMLIAREKETFKFGEFQIITNALDLPFESFEKQVFHDKINLNEVNYSDVYTNTLDSGNTWNFKYYVNKAQGLIGIEFRDELYTIVE